MQRALLTALLLLFSTRLLAELNVAVEIEGIDKTLEDNVRLYLSIEQQKNHVSMTEARLRRLHGKVFVDYAGAFTEGFGIDKMRLGLGAELILELNALYFFPTSLQLGYAHGFHADGRDQVYFLVNSPF